jgi:Family of unknown function (DUF6335)
MAKRKAARRKSTSARRGVSRGRSASRTAASTRTKKAKKTARASVRRTAKAAPRKTVKTSRKAAPSRTAKANARKAPARKATSRRTPSPTATPRSAPSAKSSVNKTPVRTAPALNRERRTIADDDTIPTPPSSLDLDRSASAVRTGRREMRERFEEHTETSPAMTGGDVDADWESAYSVGDEAPGGDNPTPDQDIVDDIGHAIGVEYQDNEELKGEAKISKRDRNRWELDPASSDDWDER